MICKNIMKPIIIIIPAVVIVGIAVGVISFTGSGSGPDGDLLNTWKRSLEHCQGIESIGGLGTQLAQYRHDIDELGDIFGGGTGEIPDEIAGLVAEVQKCMQDKQDQYGF